MYTPKPVVGGHGFSASHYKLGEAASARNACAICHAIGHVQSRLGVPAFKCWWLFWAASPFSYTLSPVSNLNPSQTPSPYLKPQCHLEPCISALPAWAAPPAAASRLFSTTTTRPRVTTRAAASARPEEVEQLAPGGPNPRHPAAQVPWYMRTYYEIRDITWLWYQNIVTWEGLIIAYMLSCHE